MESGKKFACSHCNFSASKRKKLRKHLSKAHAVVEEDGIENTKESRNQKKSLVEESMLSVDTTDIAINGVEKGPSKKKKSGHVISEPLPDTASTDINMTKNAVSPNKFNKQKVHQATAEAETSSPDKGTVVPKAKKRKSSAATFMADMPSSDTIDLSANIDTKHTSVDRNNSHHRKEPKTYQISSENKENDSACASSPVLVSVSEADDEVTLPPQPKRKRHNSKSVSETEQEESEMTHDSRVLTCPFCKPRINVFGSIKELSEHKKCEHKDVKLNCCFCSFSSSYLRKWHNHLHSAHPRSVGPILQFLQHFFQQAPEA